MSLEDPGVLLADMSIWFKSFWSDFNGFKRADPKCPVSPPLPKNYEPSTKINRPKVKRRITEADLNLQILVFVLTVSFLQFTENRRLF